MIVYVVLKNNDMCEGRGPMVLDCIFDNQGSAELYVKVRDTNFYEIKPFEVFKYSYDHPSIKKHNLKAQALAKLTLEERKALGY